MKVLGLIVFIPILCIVAYCLSIDALAVMGGNDLADGGMCRIWKYLSVLKSADMTESAWSFALFGSIWLIAGVINLAILLPFAESTEDKRFAVDMAVLGLITIWVTVVGAICLLCSHIAEMKRTHRPRKPRSRPLGYA